MLAVTKADHPLFFELCLTLLHDNGALNREETAHWQEPMTFYVPDPDPPWHPTLSFTAVHAEWVLRQLTPEERETFAIGEESAQRQQAGRHLYLGLLSRALDTWFDRGLPTDHPRAARRRGGPPRHL